MYYKPTKEEIENIPEIKEIYDFQVKNFGKQNVENSFCIGLCDKCGKVFDIDNGWTFEDNINYTGNMTYDICQSCAKDLIVNNIKPYIKTPLYNQILEKDKSLSK